jgi:hypothetical protein
VSARKFAIGLAVITIGAFALRTGYLVLVAPRSLGFNDSLTYHLEANLLADGRGFIDPYKLVAHRVTPTASHPPLFPLVLAVVSWFGGRSTFAHQAATCVLGSATVGVIGLAARRIAGPRVALLAALAAALYPNLWLLDTQVMAETLFALTVALFVLAAYGYWDQPNAGRAAATGVVVGLAALTRSEGLLLLLVAVGPMTWWSSGRSARRCLLHLGLATGAAALVIAPWVIRNLEAFDHPIVFTSNFDSVVGGSNCRPMYYGAGIGGWNFSCQTTPLGFPGDESDASRLVRQRGVRYLEHHLARVPVVVLAREARMASLLQPLSTNDFRPRGGAFLGAVSFYASTAVAVWGAILLRRRRRPLSPLVGLGILVVAVTAAGYGSIRFRIPWEVATVMLVGVALDQLLQRILVATAKVSRLTPVSQATNGPAKYFAITLSATEQPSTDGV